MYSSGNWEPESQNVPHWHLHIAPSFLHCCDLESIFCHFQALLEPVWSQKLFKLYCGQGEQDCLMGGRGDQDLIGKTKQSGGGGGFPQGLTDMRSWWTEKVRERCHQVMSYVAKLFRSYCHIWPSYAIFWSDRGMFFQIIQSHGQIWQSYAK